MNTFEVEVQLAQLFRVLGLNQKFLSDRKRELQCCRSYSLSSLMREFDVQLRGYSTSADVLNFLRSRYIAHSQEEFIDIIEQMGAETSGSISYRRLSAFFGDEIAMMEIQNSPIKPHLSEVCEKCTISIFEQLISNYRRLKVQRAKLSALGDPYELFEVICPQGELTAIQVVELVQKHCTIDDQLCAHIARSLGSEGRLSYRVFCRYAVWLQRHSNYSDLKSGNSSRRCSPSANLNLDKSSHTGQQNTRVQTYLNRNSSHGGLGRIARGGGKKLENLLSLEHKQTESYRRRPQNPTLLIQGQAHPDNRETNTREETKSFFSPSLTRLDDFEERIRILQSKHSAAQGQKPDTPEASKFDGKARSTAHSDIQRLPRKSVYGRTEQKGRNLNRFDRNLRSALRLTSPKGRATAQEYISQGTKVQEGRSGKADKSREIQTILQSKERDILAEKSLRNRLELEIERSKKQIEQLRELLNKSQEKTPPIQDELPNYSTLEYRYRSPLLDSKPSLPAREVGKIRSHNTSTPLAKATASTTGMKSSANQSLFFRRPSQRIQLQTEKLLRQFESNRRLYR